MYTFTANYFVGNPWQQKSLVINMGNLCNKSKLLTIAATTAILIITAGIFFVSRSTDIDENLQDQDNH